MNDSVTPPDEKPPAPQMIAATAMVVPLFGLVSLGLLGVAGYFAFVEKMSITQPRVWAAIVGALYFAWRGMMMYTKFKGKSSARR